MGVLEPWELSAREQIRDTMATYNHSGDRLRLEELAACFTEDGVLEIRGREPLVGRAAIIDALTVVGTSGPEPAPDVRRYVRHNVSNIRFESVTPAEAAVASYFFVVTEIGPDHWGRYRDRFVAVGDEWRIQHRFVSTDGYAPGSRFAPAT